MVALEDAQANRAGEPVWGLRAQGDLFGAQDDGNRPVTMPGRFQEAAPTAIVPLGSSPELVGLAEELATNGEAGCS